MPSTCTWRTRSSGCSTPRTSFPSGCAGADASAPELCDVKYLTSGPAIAIFGGMQLQRLLFEPTLVRSPLRVVHWWESRRPAYNLIVGATGLGTLVYINALELALGQ